VAPGMLLVLAPDVVLTGMTPGSGRRFTARVGTVSELGLPAVATSLPAAAQAPPVPSFAGLWLRNAKTNGQTVNYLNPTLLRSFGVELRFFLPISPAPLRLIWSRKVNPYPFDTNNQNDFQFSVGTTF